MAVEIQFREAALAQAVLEFVQARLFTLCAPQGLPGTDIDHLDTVPGSVSFADGGSAVSINLRIAAYLATSADVMANPNGTPDGASQVAGEIGVILSFALSGTALSVISATSDTSGLPVQEAVRQAAKAVIDAAMAPLTGQVLLETQPISSALGTAGSGDPSRPPELARRQGAIAVRFRAAGPFEARLWPVQGWGAFLDAEEVMGLVAAQLPQGFPINLSWKPNGSAPAVGLGLGIKLEGLGIDVAGLDVAATATLTFRPPRTLRIAFHWDVDLTGLASPLEGLARKEIREKLREEIRKNLPEAVHDGAQSFYSDRQLPAPPDLLGARPVWASLDSGPAGMTLGGPVRAAPAAGRGTVQVSLVPFGRPTWWGRCRERARSGSGAPPTEFAETTLRVHAGANLSDAGAFCGAEILPPHQWLAGHAQQGVDGFGFELAVAVAEKIVEDVWVVLRTARGVRLVNLGRPRIQRDEDGGLSDVQVNWLDDCLLFSGAWIKVALGERLTADDFRPDPLERDGWQTALGAVRGLNTHVIAIRGLQPGELISVRGRGMQAELVADQDGRAFVPALVGVSNSMSEVIVERLSRRPFEGLVTVETTEFTWLAEVGEADEVAILDNHGTARVARRIGGAIVVEDYTPTEAERPFIRADGGGAASLNPQPLPPDPTEAMKIAALAGLEEVVDAQPLPGISRGARLVLARLGDGTGAVVVTAGRTRRVAGRYSGPLPGMLVDGEFAVARNGRSIHLFHVRRPGEVSLNG